MTAIFEAENTKVSKIEKALVFSRFSFIKIDFSIYFFGKMY
jgi:hypothetical protein